MTDASSSLIIVIEVAQIELVTLMVLINEKRFQEKRKLKNDRLGVIKKIKYIDLCLNNDDTN